MRTSFTRMRWINLIAFLTCIGSLIGAAYFQLGMNMQPCPLCIVQRVVFLSLALVFLVRVLYEPGRMGRKIHAAMVILIAGFGIFVAGRHVWLIYHAEQAMNSCSFDLATMLNLLPLTQTIKMLFAGSGDCAKETWTFLRLYLPEWALLFFGMYAIIGVVEFFE